MITENNTEWQNLSPEQKKRRLFDEQKKTLDAFLQRGAITKQQYNKSYTDLKLKMGIED